MQANEIAVDAWENEGGLVVGNTYQWQYESRGGWDNYDVEANEKAESLHKSNPEDIVNIRSGTWDYMVDFSTLKQVNLQHHNHRVRNIRRIIQ